MLYELEEVTKVYKGRTVLDIPALSVQSEQIYSLIGPNGAGKTTLLNLLAFLDTPSSGVIRFCSRQVRYAEKLLLPMRRRVVLVDQYPILFTGSVWKNLDFGLKIRKIEKKKRKELIKEALELVGMQDFFAAEAHKLSGGETKRVALARALIVDPEVLLCDEPTANVDVENLEIILDILERINRDWKISIIFATHSLSQAQRLASHTLILKNGRLTNQAQENVFPVISCEDRGGLWVCTLQNDVRIRFTSEGLDMDSGRMHLYLDPERIVLRKKEMVGDPSFNFLSGRIIMTAAENERVRVRVNVGVPVTVFMTHADYKATLPMIGEDVHLHLDDKAVSIF